MCSNNYRIGLVLIQITALLNLSILPKLACLGPHPNIKLFRDGSWLWFESGVAVTWSPAYGTILKAL